MASRAQPPAPEPAKLLTTQMSLIQTLTSFLTTAIHSLLYTRALYPPSTFLLAKAYNTPIHQSRHPAVCSWINSSIQHLQGLLLTSSVKIVAFVVYNADLEVMERWIFDLTDFPVVGFKERFVEFESREQIGELAQGIKVGDLEEQFRACIRRLVSRGESLGSLPDRCTFTLAVELRDGADPPIGGTEKEQAWEVAEPGLQRPEEHAAQFANGRRGNDIGGARSSALRLVEAGEFVLEIWVEEGKAKVDFEKKLISQKEHVENDD